MSMLTRTQKWRSLATINMLAVTHKVRVSTREAKFEAQFNFYNRMDLLAKHDKILPRRLTDSRGG